MHNFAPTASLEMLRKRSALLAHVRAFFAENGYWEVETPLLSHDVVVDAHLHPFSLVDPASPDGMLYLQTSPEFGMKRLLAAGADRIFQVGKVFRQGEAGRLHNPEFTMAEWYATGQTHREQMDFTERLVRSCAARIGELRSPGEPFRRTTYDEAFERHAGTRVLHLGADALVALARERTVSIPSTLPPDDVDGLLNVLFAELVQPRLGADAPEFLYDYPASQAALARVRGETPPVAERFELFSGGVELCNGYHELTDAAELRRRQEVQSRIRERENAEALPQENRLLAAMDAGLPPCAGVALGVDRLLLVLTRSTSLADVLAFPFDRA